MTLDELANKAMNVRGTLINDVILLEKIIDSWLSKYFCDNESIRAEFFELILCHDRFTYSNKIQVFIYIVQNRCKDFQKQYPTFSKDLSEIGEKRNMLAHWLLDSSDEGLQSDELKFIKAKKVIPSITFSNAEILKMHTDIELYKIAIYNLVTPLPPNTLASPNIGFTGRIPS